ncbi:MAG: hypothetical protein U1D30_01135 [Planctomycetota bacterium]
MSEELEGELLIGGIDPWTKTARTILGITDTPAYLKRAIRVQDAVQAVHKRCQHQREAWLEGVRLRLRAWWTLIQVRPAEQGILTPFQYLQIQNAFSMAFSEQTPIQPVANVAKTARVFLDLSESLDRFNQRWLRFVQTVDVERANRLIEGYNRYYLFEKECAFRSPRIAALGYQPLELISPDRLLQVFPLLPTLNPKMDENEAGRSP